LQKAVNYFVEPSGNIAWVQIPHYWAVFLNDGRSRITKGPESGWLVWFQHPTDDPRTAFGRRFPVRERHVRRLTKAQFRKGMEENRRRAALGREPFMIVVKTSGPTSGKKFMERAFGAQWRRTVGRIIKAAFDAEVRKALGPQVTDQAVIRF
jgi:hypothetical protein